MNVPPSRPDQRPVAPVAVRPGFERGRSEEPFHDIVRWADRELLHHAGEIALSRDLCRARARWLPPVTEP